MSSDESEGENRLRIGIIGAGGHASSKIYPCLHTLPVRLAAVCDLDEPLARRNAELFGAEAAFTDHNEMMAKANLDAVIVCVGVKGHAKLAIDVMEAGLPVYTEKPPAASAAEAEAVLDASQRTGQICMTGFMKRFAPVYQTARAAVQSPSFGSPCLMTIDWSFGVDDTKWLETFLLDFGIHMIDLARYMFGEVTEVFAQERDGITYAVTMSFANGAIGTLGMTANRGYDITEQIDMTGRYGNHVTIDSTGRMIRYQDGRVVELYERPLSMKDSLADIGYRGELLEFANAVREGREPESSIASAYQSMRLHDAISRSATERRPIQTDEI